MTVLFISDLHLCAARPATTARFIRFLEGPAQRAEAIYILGDLFEYWAGDDDSEDPFNASVVAALASAARRVRLFLMHGNRDFLLGTRFSALSGVQLVPDPTLIDIYGVRTLLTHGDALCTDDPDYQRFRGEVRSQDWKNRFLSLPLAERRNQIEELRRRSEAEKGRKPPEIMDVNRSAVEGLMRSWGYPRIIHGHTHRPARHEHLVDGHRCEHWVLADWYGDGGHLRVDATGVTAAQE